MFRDLPAWEPPGRTKKAQESAVRSRAMDFTRDQGRSTAGDPRDNPAIPAMYTYFGQFIAHDVTFDPTSIHGRRNDPDFIVDFRTPALDLDCLYGRGPMVDPHLYGAYVLELDTHRTELHSRLRPFGFGHGRAFVRDVRRNPFEIDLPRLEESVYPIAPSGRRHAGNWLVKIRWNENKTLREVLGDQGIGVDALVDAANAEGVDRSRIGDLAKALDRRVLETDWREVEVPNDSVIFESRLGRREAFVRLSAGGLLRARTPAAPDPSWGWHSIAADRLVRRGTHAIIADPRNDENALISQLHLAFSRFHNAVLRTLAARRPDESGAVLFEEARRITRWHYQWIVVHDYLARVVGRDQVKRLLSGVPRERETSARRAPSQSSLPIEFTAGAFRFGHAMARPSYRLNSVTGELPMFAAEGEDLRGRRPLGPGWSLEWNRFLELPHSGAGGGVPQFSRRIGLCAIEAFHLRLPMIDEGLSLIELDLLRGWQMGLPSGQAAARALGVKDVVRPTTPGQDDPLLVYVLNEAAQLCDGKQLGPVGGAIVGRVLIDMLAADESSFLTSAPGWTPSREGIFDHDAIELRDLARYAGMPITAEDHVAWRMLGPPELRSRDESAPPPTRALSAPRPEGGAATEGGAEDPAGSLP